MVEQRKKKLQEEPEMNAGSPVINTQQCLDNLSRNRFFFPKTFLNSPPESVPPHLTWPASAFLSHIPQSFSTILKVSNCSCQSARYPTISILSSVCGGMIFSLLNLIVFSHKVVLRFNYYLSCFRLYRVWSRAARLRVPRARPHRVSAKAAIPSMSL